MTRSKKRAKTRKTSARKGKGAGTKKKPAPKPVKKKRNASKKKTKKETKAKKVPPAPMPPPKKRNYKRKAPPSPAPKNARGTANKRVKPNPPAELANYSPPRLRGSVSDLTAHMQCLSTGISKSQTTRRRCGPGSPNQSGIPLHFGGAFTTYNEFIQDELRTRETPNELKGRENEHGAIVNFIKETVQKKASPTECGGGSLYICGSPGTGKSATIFNISRNLPTTLSEAGVKQKYNIVKLCAMQCRTPQQIYPMILRGLNPKSKVTNPHEACQQLQRIFLNPKSDKTILIVDEIDGLLSGQVTVLYRMFEWPKQKGSNLILIGIANSIDLTNRFLPRLQQRKTQPKLIIFRPYTEEQLAAVVRDRLSIADRAWEARQLDTDGGRDGEQASLFDPMAITIISKKVAQMYGDVRKTLEICRACLDNIRNSDKKQVSFAVAKEVLKQMYGSRFSELIQNLPNQQKTLLVVSMVLFRTMPSAQRTKIFEFYSYMTRTHGLPIAKACEFGDMLSNLLSLGLLCESKRGSRSRRGWAPLKCLLQQDDIEVALESNTRLTSLLRQEHTVPPTFHSGTRGK